MCHQSELTFTQKFLEAVLVIVAEKKGKSGWQRSLSEGEVESYKVNMAQRIRTLCAHVQKARTRAPPCAWVRKVLPIAEEEEDEEEEEEEEADEEVTGEHCQEEQEEEEEECVAGKDPRGGGEESEDGEDCKEDPEEQEESEEEVDAEEEEEKEQEEKASIAGGLRRPAAGCEFLYGFDHTVGKAWQALASTGQKIAWAQATPSTGTAYPTAQFG